MKKERLERQEHYKSERKDEKGRARETRVRDRMKKKGLERQEQDNSERQDEKARAGETRAGQG
jgi:hypothetical protein